MHTRVVDDASMREWVTGTLQEMNLALPVMEHNCPHCWLPVRRPVVVHKSDVDLMAMMLKSASEVMERHGITALLLSEIRTQCLIAIAQRNSKTKGAPP